MISKFQGYQSLHFLIFKTNIHSLPFYLIRGVLSVAHLSIAMPSPIHKAVAQLHISTGDADKNLKSLCGRCRIVNWPKIMGRRYGDVICTFEGKSRIQLITSRCCVCRLVGYTLSPVLLDKERQNFNLEVSNYLEYSRTHAIIAVKNKERGHVMGYIIAHESSESRAAGFGKLEPSQVNLDLFKMKLERCFKDHGECQSTGTEIANLRVIDVHTNEVCQAPPHCDYTALSYVWGGSSFQNDKTEFPPAVQDAITATKALGCRYLWVDRYVSYYSYSKM